ncbi:hypothetical protein AJ79_09971 [Helicocarpus griseus UAMH5409]|uniref:Uncharacterized protein n=1 Tax=Helicocarpus griseus UAMH5409 TaxID=1447875 RepID=A0A2B7WGD0_9EURO|nr:hypothetical protein AJ79_09971 [Helicocarpus griseus UAMH5409]
MSAQDNWERLVQGTSYENLPCPLSYSSDSRELQQAELEKWTQSVELMDEFYRRLGHMVAGMAGYAMLIMIL